MQYNESDGHHFEVIEGCICTFNSVNKYIIISSNIF